MRHRRDQRQLASQHIQHMQKALTQMNVEIHRVISDITGLTGLAIVDAIVGLASFVYGSTAPLLTSAPFFRLSPNSHKFSFTGVDGIRSCCFRFANRAEAF
jgi:hypothetical protein